MTGTVVGRLGTWHLPFWKTNPTSQTHSLPLKKALGGQLGVDEAVIVAWVGFGWETAGVAGGTKMFLISLEVRTPEDDEALLDDADEAVLDDAVLDAPELAWVLDGAVMTVDVVVDVMETDPCTHFPPDRIKPSLDEQVLQATPPSL
jgi:hypothetical protein